MTKKLIISNLDEYIEFKTFTYELLAYIERIALSSHVPLKSIPAPNTYYIFILCSVLYEPEKNVEYKYTYKIVRQTEIQK